MLSTVLAVGTIAGSIANSIGNYQGMKEQNDIAKENLNFQKQVFNDEKRRVDKYEAERETMKQENDALASTMNANQQNPTLRV